MKYVFHLVGFGGSRKTMVAILMAQGFALKGSVCMLKDGLGGVSRFDAAKGDFTYVGDDNPAEADFLFVEHTPDAFTGGEPGDLVMHMEVVAKMADWDGTPRLEGFMAQGLQEFTPACSVSLT